jgi:hypothetical protein
LSTSLCGLSPAKPTSDTFPAFPLFLYSFSA